MWRFGTLYGGQSGVCIAFWDKYGSGSYYRFYFSQYRRHDSFSYLKSQY